MKLSNGKMEEYLNGLDACKSASGFPGMMIGIVHRRIANEIKEYLIEKQKIFEKYGKQNESGTWVITRDSKGINEAMKELFDISQIESEIDIPQFLEEEFVEKFQDNALNAQNYDTLYETFVRKEKE